MGRNFNPQSAARALARRLAVQALYRWQLNAGPWQDLINEFATETDMARADKDYFRVLVQGAIEQHVELDQLLTPLISRNAEHLDPVEHAVLLIAAIELRSQAQIPFRVIINEAVGLARRYGATDGHKFINGVLDRAARAWRPEER